MVCGVTVPCYVFLKYDSWLFTERELRVCASLGATLSLHINPSVCLSIMIQICVHCLFTHDWQSNTWKTYFFLFVIDITACRSQLRKQKILDKRESSKKKPKKPFFDFLGEIMNVHYWEWFFINSILYYNVLVTNATQPCFCLCLILNLSNQFLNLVFCFGRWLSGREIFFPSCGTGCGGRD